MKPDNEAVRAGIKATPLLIMFGRYNERLYVWDVGAQSMYIPSSFRGAIFRRHVGTVNGRGKTTRRVR